MVDMLTPATQSMPRARHCTHRKIGKDIPKRVIILGAYLVVALDAIFQASKRGRRFRGRYLKVISDIAASRVMW